MHWFEKAEEELDVQYENGEISYKEYQREIRGLRIDMMALADREAENARLRAIDGFRSQM